ncbi:MAG: Nif3-like dinuclear metal center hexameric protein [Gemmatimonadota bacterium]|nr:Nif3-like dinuclear metal center hexameric protein [Gemmatimonadota bacterium]
MKLSALVDYLNGYLDVPGHPDYPTALNGLQMDGPEHVAKLAAAVDASEEVIEAAAEAGVDLVLVHHGLFWDGLRPVTGRRYRKVKRLLDAGIAVYSVHLPLDAHAEVGNCALLGRSLGLELQDRFGSYKGSPVGWWGTLPEPVDSERLSEMVADALGGGPVRHLEGSAEWIGRVGVVTGAGGSMVEEAAGLGLDALVTGEASHHTYVDARELGVHVFLGGHYATETFGVKALAEHLAERFRLDWSFLDHPSGL